ncbi:transposable element Tcb2 transposase [Trichonephila clavipes]|nr:transposable element Tcb2 transposase [Trichonephila clavipes]
MSSGEWNPAKGESSYWLLSSDVSKWLSRGADSSTLAYCYRSVSSIRQRLLHRGLRARVPLYGIPLTANHQWQRLQWAHEHRAWQTHWPQVVFLDESRFNLWDHDGRIHVRCYVALHTRVLRVHCDVDFCGDRVKESNIPTEDASLLHVHDRPDRLLSTSFMVSSVSN